MFGHARGPKPQSIPLAVSRWTAHYTLFRFSGMLQDASPTLKRVHRAQASRSQAAPCHQGPAHAMQVSDARPHNPQSDQSEQDEDHAESAGLRSAPSTICSKGGHLRTSGPICGEYPQAKTFALLGYQGRRSASQ